MAVIVPCLILVVPWVYLWSVMLAFPGHTNLLLDYCFLQNTAFILCSAITRIKSGKFGHQVNSDTRLQTVEIQMRRLLMSCLIRIFTVYLVNFFFVPIIEL